MGLKHTIPGGRAEASAEEEGLPDLEAEVVKLRTYKMQMAGASSQACLRTGLLGRAPGRREVREENPEVLRELRGDEHQFQSQTLTTSRKVTGLPVTHTRKVTGRPVTFRVW